ncbi:hypothetical protein B4U80_11646, partial [Leptotrombidium deliense]
DLRKMTSTTTTETANNTDEQKAKAVAADTVAENNTETAKDGGDAAKKEEKSDEQKESGDASPSKKAVPKPAVHKVDYEQDIVYLYQFPRCPTVPSVSPYCLKVETWLRMAGIAYENVDHKMKYKSKKGQLPFIELNGKEIADSDIIINELSEHFSKNVDEGLTDEQRTVSHAFESMLNNHTTWVVRWWRYNNPGEFITAAKLDIKRTLNSKLPKGLLNFFFKIGFRSNVKQAVGHGLGRHSTEEIYDFGKSDLKALSKQLADKEYFFGKEPHLLDCVAFAHLCQFIYVPFGDMKEWMDTETANLLAFVQRMKERYWTDWDEACESLELNTHLPKKEKSEEAKKEEEIKEEEKKKKEEKKRQKEEAKREKEEKKKREKEEKERKKQEEKEKAEKEKAEKEKAEKEKAEKEKAEKEKAEKEKADEESAEKDKEAAKSAESEKTEEKKSEETATAADKPATKDTEEVKQN